MFRTLVIIVVVAVASTMMFSFCAPAVDKLFDDNQRQIEMPKVR